MLWSQGLTNTIKTTSCKYVSSYKVSLEAKIEFRWSPLNRIDALMRGDKFRTEEKLTSILNCRRLLLNAGADSILRGSFGELFEQALVSYTAVRISS